RDPARLPLGGALLSLHSRQLAARGAIGAALVCVLLWGVLVLLSVRTGATGTLSWDEVWRATGALVGLAEPLPGNQQAIVRLRFLRALCAGGVGGALALAGAYLQGLYQNGLASPSVVGVTAGA